MNKILKFLIILFKNIMRRFDVNGDCRIELEDFITIMNFAQIKNYMEKKC
jgi:hypothetical protein